MTRARPTASEFFSSSYDPELERAFFSRIRLANGSWKTTDRARFDDLNEAVLPFIREIPERPIEIMDIAVSSGISSQEWSDQLSPYGLDVCMIGTDLCLEARHLQGRFIEALLDDRWNILHLGLFGRGISARGRIYHAPLIQVLKALVRFSIANGAKTQPVRLTSKALRTVTLLEDDIETVQDRFRERFHVIRAANVLNLAYFSSTRLKKMAEVLRGRLRPGGLLIVSRTDEHRANDATIFKLSQAGLQVIKRVGRGSELEPFVS